MSRCSRSIEPGGRSNWSSSACAHVLKIAQLRGKTAATVFRDHPGAVGVVGLAAGVDAGTHAAPTGSVRALQTAVTPIPPGEEEVAPEQLPESKDGSSEELVAHEPVCADAARGRAGLVDKSTSAAVSAPVAPPM
jgi:hypothetical protein